MARSSDFAGDKRSFSRINTFKQAGTHLVLGAEKYLSNKINESSDDESSSLGRENEHGKVEVRQKPRLTQNHSKIGLVLADRKFIKGSRQSLPFGSRFAESKTITEEEDRKLQDKKERKRKEMIRQSIIHGNRKNQVNLFPY